MISLNETCKCTFAGFLCLLLFISCTTTKQTLYLQEIDIYGPINQAPIHLTDSIETPSVIISPRFSVNTQKEFTAKTGGHSMVNINGIFQVDTSFFGDGTVKYTEAPGKNVHHFEDQNLNWNVSTITAGIDFDFVLTRNFALFGGVSYSSQQSGGVWGGNAGLGLFGNGKSVSFRFDAGVHIQTMKYDASTIADIQTESIFGGSDEYVVFYHDIDKSTNFDPFINFTINSANKEWLINFFFNAGYSIQSLYDFGPQTPDTRYYNFLLVFPTGTVITQDFRGENTAGFFNFTPGIYFNLNENSRVLLGVRFYFETQLENPSTSTFILPMLQADFVL
jgi:hypothetical protein